MKRYKNVSNRTLQFALAGIELAPGQEAAVSDTVVRNDPGFEICLEQGSLEDLGRTRRTSNTGKKKPSKSDMFDADGKSKGDDESDDEGESASDTERDE